MTIDNSTDETTPNASSPAASPAAPKWLAALGLAAGLGAVIASSCCVIPLGLAAVGAGAGVFGGLELLAEWRVPFLSVSALAIVGGWGAWWWKRPDACVATGSVAPAKMGGRREVPVLEPHRGFIIERIQQTPHLTLHGRTNKLAARGVKVSHNAVWLFLRHEGLRFKNIFRRRVCRLRRRAQTPSKRTKTFFKSAGKSRRCRARLRRWRYSPCRPSPPRAARVISPRCAAAGR